MSFIKPELTLPVVAGIGSIANACGNPWRQLQEDGTPIAASVGAACPVCRSMIFRSVGVVSMELGKKHRRVDDCDKALHADGNTRRKMKRLFCMVLFCSFVFGIE